MATCPKCGKKLRLYHWRPECPACGVNMIYYASNERLLAETEKTEIEHAKFQPKVDRAKAAFFGSPWVFVSCSILQRNSDVAEKAFSFMRKLRCSAVVFCSGDNR